MIDTKIDFSNHKIYFWLNNKPQGSIDLHVEEGTVYPAVTLSQFSKVTILALDHISEGLDLETRLQQMLDISVFFHPMGVTYNASPSHRLLKDIGSGPVTASPLRSM